MSDRERSCQGPSIEAGSGALNKLRARRLGIDTQYEAVVFMRKDCPICRSEGFAAHTRVKLTAGPRWIMATLYQVTSNLLDDGEAGLSDSAWHRLGLRDGDDIAVSHPPPLKSLSILRGKIYGKRLEPDGIADVVADIANGRYSDIHLSSFITACAAGELDTGEIAGLTQAMVKSGRTLVWERHSVFDKHCVGGLPGNRTTPIVVAIVAANGLTMPKTSSRAITSPAGTADTMETMAPVDLDLGQMRRVVEAEGGCCVWGGAVGLSPVDDKLIRIERALEVDSVGQMVASILSKKIAAGSNHVILDVPVGPTAKVRSRQDGEALAACLTQVGEAFGLESRVILTDGSAPVGQGIGPALEARDVLAVLQGTPEAPADLRERALVLAGAILEMAETAAPGAGFAAAAATLDSGAAWKKFKGICEAQGGLRDPQHAAKTRVFVADRDGTFEAIDNRRIARVAKLAGAPDAKSAGVFLHKKPGEDAQRGEPLFTVHAESPGELDYAMRYVEENPGIVTVEPRP